jgi:hypothetical protein
MWKCTMSIISWCTAPAHSLLTHSLCLSFEHLS